MAEVKEPAAFVLMPGTQEQLAKFGLEIIETAERERLEQAVLNSWIMQDPPGVFGCVQCMGAPQSSWRDYQHAEDCLVPVLIAKHETP